MNFLYSNVSDLITFLTPADVLHEFSAQTESGMIQNISANLSELYGNVLLYIQNIDASLHHSVLIKMSTISSHPSYIIVY